MDRGCGGIGIGRGFGCTVGVREACEACRGVWPSVCLLGE